MPRRDLHHGRGRLAALLGPWPTDRTAVGDPPGEDAPTVPLPAAPPLQRRRDRLALRWFPAGWHGARLDPGRPGTSALLLTAAVAAVVAAVGVWWEAPRAERVPDLPAFVETTPTGAPTGPKPTPGPPEPLVVAVAGRVARPGLVRVAVGARVADVLAAAGGPLPGTDLAGVNLARKVRDGEQVAIGVPGAPDAGSAPPAVADPTGPVGSAGPPDVGVPGAPLDLNAATVEQLDGLPGVGPVTAQRIVEWRTRNGRFATVDQLREVAGVGERRLAQLRELVRV